MSLPNRSWKKKNKNEQCHGKLIFSMKKNSNGYTMRSFSQQYIYTYVYKSENPVKRPYDSAVLYSTYNFHGEQL